MTVHDRPVERHGHLNAKNSQLFDDHSNRVQLRGMSSHGMQWHPKFMNAKSMEWLRDKWGASVVRFAMYLDEDGYMTDEASQQKLRAAMQSAVVNAIRSGLYAVVDWHVHPSKKYAGSGDPRKYKRHAVEFFRAMANEFGKFPNIIYEIANEPGEDLEWGDIREYAEEVVAAIRDVDQNNLIVVGSPRWSQLVDVAAESPLTAHNVAYAFHFYAGTHVGALGDDLRARIQGAMDMGQTVFVSEWGTTDASGKGVPRESSSREWIHFLNERGISWINWSLCDESEESAALRVGARAEGGWPDPELSPSGLLVRSLMLAD
jgi:endoglucanase